MMDAHVDGRPIPLNSSSFTNVASVYRGGGEVVCDVEVYSATDTELP